MKRLVYLFICCTLIMDCIHPLSGFCQYLSKQTFIIAPDQNNKLPDSLHVAIQVIAPTFDSCAENRSFDFDIYFQNQSKDIVFLPAEIDVYDDSGIAGASELNKLTNHPLKPGTTGSIKIRIFNTQKGSMDKSGKVHLMTASGNLTAYLHLRIDYPLSACNREIRFEAGNNGKY